MYKKVVTSVCAASMMIVLSSCATGGPSGGGTPPVASFTATPIVSAPPMNVSVDASSSGGTSLRYSWDWGDRSPASTGVTANHTYTQLGSYTITLTVTDAQGATSTVTRQVHAAVS